ncbi:hypothetical protein ACOME3_004325 [Neoechinorhynchus agilis]
MDLGCVPEPSQRELRGPQTLRTPVYHKPHGILLRSSIEWYPSLMKSKQSHLRCSLNLVRFRRPSFHLQLWSSILIPSEARGSIGVVGGADSKPFVASSTITVFLRQIKTFSHEDE